jgi:hypothetical protein
VSLLKRVDLPTFGLPIIATVFNMTFTHSKNLD